MTMFMFSVATIHGKTRRSPACVCEWTGLLLTETGGYRWLSLLSSLALTGPATTQYPNFRRRLAGISGQHERIHGIQPREARTQRAFLRIGSYGG